MTLLLSLGLAVPVALISVLTTHRIAGWPCFSDEHAGWYIHGCARCEDQKRGWRWEAR